ncbi:hypothetical protein [Nonomuraea sediminis]|uniref:hypothetical protein n=1 Tax=Nonomuraea sediminis TaxID=2835864 RepID=UPI001BDCD882|nr:hypothetical protein [Nonomuraea sediminis]
MSNSIADLRAKVRRPEKSVALCLAGDLQAQFEDLERELATARDRSAGTLAGGSAEATEIAQKIRALEAEMQEHTEVFRFKGLTRREYKDLVAEHPPSSEDEEKGNDVDWETFGVGLIAACCVSHPMTYAEAGELVDILTAAQYGSLFQAAQAVNVHGLDVPKSFSAYAVLQGSKRNSR